MATWKACVLSRSAVQSIPDSVYTPITWTNELVDQSGLHTPNSNTTAVPTNWEGSVFMVTAAVKWAGNTTGQRRLRLMKNSEVIAEAFGLPSTYSLSPMTISAHVVVSGGDLLRIDVWQNSGGALDLDPSSRFGAHVIHA